MPSPLQLPSDVYKEDGRWIRLCPVCNDKVSHLRRNYCAHSSLLKQPCNKCSNKNNNPSGMVGSVRVAWLTAFMKSGLSRGYVWDLTPEFIDAMYNEQGGLCAISGLPISWSVSGWSHTASIDRIDNNVGYVESNVQLVHKEVNMMRGSLDVERFQELCCLIADKVRW